MRTPIGGAAGKGRDDRDAIDDRAARAPYVVAGAARAAGSIRA